MPTVREQPPLQLSIVISTPSGLDYRWALDEPDASNTPGALSFSSTMPGGFENMSCTLPRQPDADYPDLAEFSTITVYSAGGRVVWQGRLETAPRTSGNQMVITPGAVGWQAHLSDDKTARMIYQDIDLTRWQDPSVARKVALLTAPADIDGSAGVTPDPVSGFPALTLRKTGVFSRVGYSEAWYDAKGMPLASIYVAWRNQPTVNPADTNWVWQGFVSSDDIATAFDTTGNLRATGPGTSFVFGTGLRTWAGIQLGYATGPAGAEGTNYDMEWTCLAITGTHGLPFYGTPDYVSHGGYLASDIVRHAVTTWAPKLAIQRGGISTIEPTTFVIPHLAFLDPVTAADILAGALTYELVDWWVDEGPTFNIASRGNHGRSWRARVGPSGLSETGPQVDRIANRVIVAYNDVTGAVRTVGPTGSGANTIDDTLADNDPTNAATAAGLVIYPPPLSNIGVSTPAAAVKVGQRWLAELRAASTAGQATIVGVVQDSNGVWWPASAIRAGDNITFLDAHDPVPRRIVRTQYTHDSKANQLDLDSPAQDLDALLARMSIALTAIGFS